jgi:tetratricopeptide (TPR) repeat protein
MNFPPEMQQALRQRTAVLVAGTGCGSLYGAPGWRARIERLAGVLPKWAAEQVRDQLGRGALVAALAAARDRLGPQAARVVAGMGVRPAGVPAVLTALASAPWRAVITTGFDDIWLRALKEGGAAPVVLSAGEPLKPPGKWTLIHAFGRAARPETMCLASNDLPDRVMAHGLERSLRELARTCSFVYVGFQPGDPDLEWMAGRVLGPSGRERPHFALVTEAEAGKASLLRGAFGIRPVPLGESLESGLSAVAGLAALMEEEAAAAEQGAAAAKQKEEEEHEEAAAADQDEEEQDEEEEEEHEEEHEEPLAALAQAAVQDPGTGELELEDLHDAEPDGGSVAARDSLRVSVARHMEGERWEDVSAELRHLAEIEPDDAARAKLLHARALVLKDQLQDRAGAVALLEEALKANPALVAAWDALEPLQRGGGDPAALRRAYGRALPALDQAADRELALRLWKGVAEVSWPALGDHATAVAALEAVRTLDPDDEGPERALAALYLKAGPDASDGAVAAHQALAAHTPDDAEPYRVLERLWREEPAPERASWAAAALGQLGQATDHQAGLVTGLRPTLATRTLSEPLWESLYHPDEDRVLSTLFVVLCPSLVALMAEPHKGFPPRGVEPVPTVDPSATRPSRAVAGVGASDFAAAALAHVAHVLEVQPPALFLADSRRRPLTLRLRADWPGVRPALILDRRFAARVSEAELLFELARTVALLRPPWVIRFGARAAAVADLGLRAALTLCGVEPEGKRDVQRLLQQLREARPDLAQEQIAALASELAHRPALPDLARWLAAIELSAARAALVVTGDLDAAVRSVRAETARPGGLAPGERVKDLLAFSVSEDHFATRAALGLDGGGRQSTVDSRQLGVHG